MVSKESTEEVMRTVFDVPKAAESRNIVDINTTDEVNTFEGERNSEIYSSVEQNLTSTAGEEKEDSTAPTEETLYYC